MTVIIALAVIAILHSGYILLMRYLRIAIEDNMLTDVITRQRMFRKQEELERLGNKGFAFAYVISVIVGGIINASN